MDQCQVVHDFVADLLSIEPDARVVVLGDMNDFYFSPPIDLLEGEILQNLIETLPLEERYSYIYDGNSQTLDQMLASEGMMNGFVSMDILHINSEWDYESHFSDHDPLIATFNLP